MTASDEEPNAQFVLCQFCEKHGRIIFTQGLVTPEICFQDQGRYYVRDALSRDRIVSIKVAEWALQEIMNAPFPKTAHDVDPALFHNARKLREVMTSEGRMWSDNEIHDFLQSPVSPEEIPDDLTLRAQKEVEMTLN